MTRKSKKENELVRISRRGYRWELLRRNSLYRGLYGDLCDKMKQKDALKQLREHFSIPPFNPFVAFDPLHCRFKNPRTLRNNFKNEMALIRGRGCSSIEMYDGRYPAVLYRAIIENMGPQHAVLDAQVSESNGIIDLHFKVDAFAEPAKVLDEIEVTLKFWHLDTKFSRSNPVHFRRLKKRLQLYDDRIMDPKKWTFKKLAKKYGFVKKDDVNWENARQIANKQFKKTQALIEAKGYRYF